MKSSSAIFLFRCSVLIIDSPLAKFFTVMYVTR